MKISTGLLIERVYALGKVFSALNELRSVIFNELREVAVETIHVVGNLVERYRKLVNKREQDVSQSRRRCFNLSSEQSITHDNDQLHSDRV